MIKLQCVDVKGMHYHLLCWESGRAGCNVGNDVGEGIYGLEECARMKKRLIKVTHWPKDSSGVHW